jgi:FtsP/CotA-like multicopper oxidase with cupredoxin domain
VQVINRVAIDGTIPPDANELGWKETVRMNPGQDVIIAIRPMVLRRCRGSSVTASDLSTRRCRWAPRSPTLGNTTVTNVLQNFGWEYVWHCHLLGHEENDMMRPMVFDCRS